VKNFDSQGKLLGQQPSPIRGEVLAESLLDNERRLRRRSEFSQPAISFRSHEPLIIGNIGQVCLVGFQECYSQRLHHLTQQ
jgi:hypothetical protein